MRILKRSGERLPCRLTIEERLERAGSLAATLADIRSEESGQEMQKAAMKSRMRSLEAKRDELQLIVSRGEEVREVEVEEQANDAAQMVIRIRTDSGEVIHERRMTDSERQEKLPLAEAGVQ